MAISRNLQLLTVIVIMTCAGCVSRQMQGLADTMADAAIKYVFPPLQLSFAATAFRRSHERWPTNYAELSAFNISRNGAALTNYDRVDFSQTPDGGLEMLAFGAGTSNRITLHPTERK